MSQTPTRCPKCEGAMEQGFILDNTQGIQVASRWAAGVPRKSFGSVQKAVPEGAIIPLGAFRCESCGYLESYARPEYAAR